MKIDWIAKLRHLLQVLAFCLAISAIQYAFTPERPYEIPLVYSLFIGVATWVLIDFGRHLFASSAASGWPQGLGGFVLTLAGSVGGHLLGTLASDSWFGWSTWESGNTRTHLRNSILITALAGIAASYYFYSVGKRAYLERQMAEASQHANEARLKLLETQLEPHMLFNTLANLRALIGSDPARATDMLDRLIAYLRATLAASRQTTHPLSEEFARLRDYLELMAVRMGPRLRYTLDLPADLGKLPVPTLLLQPLVENSIKHGLEPKVDGGSLTVRARRKGAVLTLEVSDTGVGLRPAAPGGAGFGLAQVRARLAAAYDKQAAIELIAEPGSGTTASISLPCAP
jgi:signal transduction histidine kinase